MTDGTDARRDRTGSDGGGKCLPAEEPPTTLRASPWGHARLARLRLRRRVGLGSAVGPDSACLRLRLGFPRASAPPLAPIDPSLAPLRVRSRACGTPLRGWVAGAGRVATRPASFFVLAHFSARGVIRPVERFWRLGRSIYRPEAGVSASEPPGPFLARSDGRWSGWIGGDADWDADACLISSKRLLCGVWRKAVFALARRSPLWGGGDGVPSGCRVRARAVHWAVRPSLGLFGRKCLPATGLGGSFWISRQPC